ncbi:MAG: beta-carotene hydroxylase [Bacteroidia bacterium]|jgi:beta-carotene hydroxylase
MRQASLIRYKADYRTIVTVIAYAIFYPVSWVLWAKVGWVGKVTLVVVHCNWQYIIATIIHNTIHVPIFRSMAGNRAFQFFLSAIKGNPVSGYVPGHNLSHHKHMQTAFDPIRTTRARFGWNLINQSVFFFLCMFDIMKSEKAFVNRMKDVKPGWAKQYKREAMLVGGIKLILFIVDWQRMLLLVFLPNMYSLWGIFGTNYWQHDGCDETHPYNHSRSFTGKLFNWLTFNNGYHGIHHLYMGVHWSLYPDYHERLVKPHVHPNLDQKSLIEYLWKSCIYPGKRLDYLGNPVHLPPKVETADWVADVSIDPEAKVALGAIQ